MSGRTFVTGDIHANIDLNRLSSKHWSEGRNLDRDDYLIVAGDMGILWNNKPNALEKHIKRWLGKEKPWTTLFVDGNHENHPRLQELPIEEKFGGKVGFVSDNIYHLRRGEIYTINNKKFFTFGGATSWDKGNRIENVSWWSDEVCNHKETEYALDNLEKNQWKVDCVVTHTAPRCVIPMMGFSTHSKGAEQCPTSGFLEHIARNLNYENWYCGHFHLDRLLGKFHMLYYKIVQIF